MAIIKYKNNGSWDYLGQALFPVGSGIWALSSPGSWFGRTWVKKIILIPIYHMDEHCKIKIIIMTMEM